MLAKHSPLHVATSIARCYAERGPNFFSRHVYLRLILSREPEANLVIVPMDARVRSVPIVGSTADLPRVSDETAMQHVLNAYCKMFAALIQPLRGGCSAEILLLFIVVIVNVRFPEIVGSIGGVHGDSGTAARLAYGSPRQWASPGFAGLWPGGFRLRRPRRYSVGIELAHEPGAPLRSWRLGGAEARHVGAAIVGGEYGGEYNGECGPVKKGCSRIAPWSKGRGWGGSAYHVEAVAHT